MNHSLCSSPGCCCTAAPSTTYCSISVVQSVNAGEEDLITNLRYVQLLGGGPTTPFRRPKYCRMKMREILLPLVICGDTSAGARENFARTQLASVGRFPAIRHDVVHIRWGDDSWDPPALESTVATKDSDLQGNWKVVAGSATILALFLVGLLLALSRASSKRTKVRQQGN